MRACMGAVLFLMVLSTEHRAQVNAGSQAPEATLPFTMTQVAEFNLPWRIAFLPDGRMLITEKVGPVWLVTQQGAKKPVKNVPAVLAQGQGGMLFGSPVPTQMMSEFDGATATAPTDPVRTESKIAVHETPALVDRYTPPVATAM